MWGTSVGGKETHNSWSTLPESAYPAGVVPSDLKPRTLVLSFEKGRPVALDGQALSPEGTFVRYDGEGRPPVTDGPFAETKDLIAGWMVIDVETYERAVELAGELSAAPGPGGKPIYEWLEVRPFLTAPPTVTE